MIVAVPTISPFAFDVAVTVILSPVFASAETFTTPSSVTSIAVPLAFLADHVTPWFVATSPPSPYTAAVNLTSSPAFAVTAAGDTTTEVGSTNDTSFTSIVNSTESETVVPFTVAVTVTLSPFLALSVVVTTPSLSTVAAVPSTLHTISFTDAFSGVTVAVNATLPGATLPFFLSLRMLRVPFPSATPSPEMATLFASVVTTTFVVAVSPWYVDVMVVSPFATAVTLPVVSTVATSSLADLYATSAAASTTLLCLATAVTLPSLVPFVTRFKVFSAVTAYTFSATSTLDTVTVHPSIVKSR